MKNARVDDTGEVNDSGGGGVIRMGCVCGVLYSNNYHLTGQISSSSSVVLTVLSGRGDCDSRGDEAVTVLGAWMVAWRADSKRDKSA
jgi:hypothetical protein